MPMNVKDIQELIDEQQVIIIEVEGEDLYGR
jgi:hypothetical protein